MWYVRWFVVEVLVADDLVGELVIVSFGWHVWYVREVVEVRRQSLSILVVFMVVERVDAKY